MSEYDMSIHANPDAAAWARFFMETAAKHGWRIEGPDEATMLGWFANAMCAALDARSRAPSPPETPAPVHYLARYAAGSFTACDPTIKDGWTTDPLGVTCEECRKVIRWRCEQVPAPETSAPDADRCDCDGQKGQGCTICASLSSAPPSPDSGDSETP